MFINESFISIFAKNKAKFGFSDFRRLRRLSRWLKANNNGNVKERGGDHPTGKLEYVGRGIGKLEYVGRGILKAHGCKEHARVIPRPTLKSYIR